MNLEEDLMLCREAIQTKDKYIKELRKKLNTIYVVLKTKKNGKIKIVNIFREKEDADVFIRNKSKYSIKLWNFPGGAF